MKRITKGLRMRNGIEKGGEHRRKPFSVERFIILTFVFVASDKKSWNKRKQRYPPTSSFLEVSQHRQPSFCQLYCVAATTKKEESEIATELSCAHTRT